MKTDDPIPGTLEELFLEGSISSARDARALHDALAGSPDDAPIRRAYDRLAIASRALEQGTNKPAPDRMSQMELAFQEQVFASALDDMLAAESHSDASNASEKKQAQIIDFKSLLAKNKTLVATSLAAILAATLGASLLIDPTGEDPSTQQPDEFTARGQREPLSPLHIADAATRQELEAFCITRQPGAASPHVASSKDAPFGLFSCPVDGELQFAYLASTLPSRHLRHLSIFGVSSHGKLLWYGPSPASHAPYTLQDSAKPTPLPQAIALGVNHAPEESVRVFALFSQSPWPHAKMERLLTGRADVMHALFDDPERFARLLEESPETRGAGELHAVTLTFDVTEVTQP